MIDVLFLLLSMTEFALTFSLRSPALCTCLPTSYIFSSSVELPPSLFLFLSTLGIPSLTPLPSLLSSVFSDFSSLLSSSPLLDCVISRTLLSLFSAPLFPFFLLLHFCALLFPPLTPPLPVTPPFLFPGLFPLPAWDHTELCSPQQRHMSPPGLLLTPPISSLRPHLGFQTLTVPDRTPITIPGPP